MHSDSSIFHADGGGGGARARRTSARNLFERREVKFELGAASAAFLRREIARRLPVFEFAPGNAHTYVTTIYFDTADRTFFKKARQDYHDNDKIRVKEYYYAVPSEARGASAGPDGSPLSASNGVGAYQTSPEFYLELKQRRGDLVTKKRLSLPKSRLTAFFEGEDLRAEIGGGDSEASRDEAYAALRDYLERFRVRATSVITYRRQVFQLDEDDLRITFDDEIAVYEPPAGLYAEVEALTPAVLGVPIRSFSKVITEIKCAADEYPDWLQQALRNHSSKFLSKFTTSVSSVFREAEAETDTVTCSETVTSSGTIPTTAESRPPTKPVSGAKSLDDTWVSRKPTES